VVAVLVAAALPTTAAVGQSITPEQVVALEQVTSVALSPDGDLVAFSLSKPRTADDPVGRRYTELWVVPAAGGEPRAVIRRPLSAFSPRWSPDGRLLTFTARLEDHQQTQVYGVPAEGGDRRLMTQSPTGVFAYAWAPDGSAVAYTTRMPVPPEVLERRKRGFDAVVAGEGERHVRLWVQPLSGGNARAITPDGRTVRSFAWAPDGERFALQVTAGTSVDEGYMDRKLYTVAATGGALEPLTETWGKLGGMAWSPDVAHLAFASATSRNDPLAQSVFVVAATGGTATNVTPDYQGSALSIRWLDRETVAFVAGEGTRTVLNRVPARGGTITRVAGGGPEIFTSVSFDARSRTFAASGNTSQHPGEVFVGAGSDGLRRVTEHNPYLAGVELARQETISWTSVDGWRIEGVLVRPLGEPQLLAAEGYAVLLPNYRGSGGRGVAFSKGDHRDLGGKEFDDVIAGIDHLAEQGLVDPNRVGISGTSYGGYFSAWAATRHTDRFQAAITFAGISNWASFTGTTEIPYEMSLVHWDLWPHDDPGFAWDRSPLAHVKGSKTATLIGHGMSDTRVHPEQSLELHTTLKVLGVPTGLVLYPREPHGLTERAHELDFMGRILEWFGTYVKIRRQAT
jgi:dipeptidyl aminopeptidase/acylaminoacyl peptidase